MELTPDTNKSLYQIRSYEPGKITINDQVYTQSLWVSLTTLELWPPSSMAELKPEDFQVIAAQNPAIVLLGTGKQQQFPAPKILSLLYNQKIGVEVMDTAAACRTFSILSAEGRNVIAALFI